MAPDPITQAPPPRLGQPIATDRVMVKSVSGGGPLFDSRPLRLKSPSVGQHGEARVVDRSAPAAPVQSDEPAASTRPVALRPRLQVAIRDTPHIAADKLPEYDDQPERRESDRAKGMTRRDPGPSRTACTTSSHAIPALRV